VRIWLSGRTDPTAADCLADFPHWAVGSHIKLLLQRPGQLQLSLPHWTDQGPVWPDAHLRPISRTFTLAAWDPTCCQVAIDFAVHEQPGPAAQFARHAPLHSPVGLAGPGGPVLANLDAEQWWLFADLTGLALVRALLRIKPPQVQVQAFISLPANGQTLPMPGVHWCIGEHALVAQAQQLARVDVAHSWVVLACEYHPWQRLQHHWLNQRQLPRHNLYSLPYWRAQQTEECFHSHRHQALDALPATHWHT
jgi:NADPH-dependent ferric siderophore reductase